ncbi:hypothetical protein RCJ22_11880 [Vibrio sp. FNV 38]|nr:hypothetical protein [Vibrio sp. FNV 38]
MSYFVMEPGSTTIDGNDIVAGYLDTTKFKSKGSGGDSAPNRQVDVVAYSVFNGVQLDDEPVVLHQLQTKNNPGQWMTSGKLSSSQYTYDESTETRLFIELSATGNNQDSYNERIGFIATNESAQLQDGSHILTFGRENSTNQSSGSAMADGCDELFDTGLDAPTGLIVKKRGRRGGDGGWARRCELNGSGDDAGKFSVVIDEDNTNRAHIIEELGYFAFESPVELPDLCELFPEPAQSWNISSSGPYASYGPSVLDVTNGDTAKIIGWSDSYVQSNLIEKDTEWGRKTLLKTGFDTTTNLWHIYENQVCTAAGCEVGNDDGGISERKIDEPEVVDLVSATGELDIDGNNFSTVCSGNSYCRYSQNGSTGEIEILSNLKSLLISIYNGNVDNFVIRFADGIHIGSVEVKGSKNVQVRYSNNAIVTFGDITYSDGNLSLHFEENTRINVKDLWEFKNPFPITYDAETSDTIIYGPEASFIFNTPTTTFYGYIVGKWVDLLNPITIFGSVSAHKLTMKQGAVIHRPDDLVCTPSPPVDYEIILTPTSDIALTCEVIPLEATVYRDNVPDTSFTGSVTLYDSNGQSINSENASGGVAKFDLSTEVPNQSQTRSGLYAQTQIGDVTYRSASSGDYKFVPFRFEVKDQYVIAGKDTSVTASVLACDDGSSTPDLGYVGSPDMSYAINIPTSGAVGDLTYAPEFDSGESTADLIFSDAGQLTVTLVDENYNCTGFEDCPIDDTGTGTAELSGSFVVNARPWTLAICDVNGGALSGTSSGGSKHVAAGDTFALNIRPVVWNNSLDETEQKPNYADFCSLDVTQNFFNSTGWSSDVELQHTITSPDGGVSGEMSGTKIQVDVPSRFDAPHILFGDLKVSEVGSFDIKASATGYNSILGGIDNGSREIGRFYPAYFNIEDGDWVAQDDQGNVAYLGQAYKSWDLKVYPYSAENSRVRNYHLFADAYKANFPALQDVDGYVSRLIGWESDNNGLWGDDSVLAASVWMPNFDLTFERKGFTGDTTTPDGPFNTSDDGSIATKIELVIKGPDPVNFELESPINDAQFTDVQELQSSWQPPARYGRMTMSDVGGTLNEDIPIPLKVEYWDSSWKINTDDSASEFISDASYLCYQGNDSSATLSGSNSRKKVEFGNKPETSDLTAINNGTADSVRVWMKMDSSKPSEIDGVSILCQSAELAQPWLMYNWRNAGDEHPSSLITFGIYRGNDRIIFRGEPGLTGQ